MPQSPSSAASVGADVGAYNSVLGRSYTEIAAESRSMHKSQGFGAAARRGTFVERFEPVAGEPASQDLFDGIDISWARVPGGQRVDALLAEAEKAATDDAPEAAVPQLLAALAAIDRLEPDPLVARKRGEIQDAIRSAAGLWLEAVTADERVTPGSSQKV